MFLDLPVAVCRTATYPGTGRQSQRGRTRSCADHPDRHPCARTAAGPAAYPRPPSGAADVSLPDQRVHQLRSARAHRPSCAD